MSKSTILLWSTFWEVFSERRPSIPILVFMVGVVWNRSQLCFRPKSKISKIYIFEFICFNIYFVVLIFKSTDFEIYAKSKKPAYLFVFDRFEVGLSQFSARSEQNCQGAAHFTFPFWNPTLQPAYSGVTSNTQKSLNKSSTWFCSYTFPSDTTKRFKKVLDLTSFH